MHSVCYTSLYDDVRGLDFVCAPAVCSAESSNSTLIIWVKPARDKGFDCYHLLVFHKHLYMHFWFCATPSRGVRARKWRSFSFFEHKKNVSLNADNLVFFGRQRCQQ